MLPDRWYTDFLSLIKYLPGGITVKQWLKLEIRPTGFCILPAPEWPGWNAQRKKAVVLKRGCITCPSSELNFHHAENLKLSKTLGSLQGEKGEWEVAMTCNRNPCPEHWYRTTLSPSELSVQEMRRLWKKVGFQSQLLLTLWLPEVSPRQWPRVSESHVIIGLLLGQRSSDARSLPAKEPLLSFPMSPDFPFWEAADSTLVVTAFLWQHTHTLRRVIKFNINIYIYNSEKPCNCGTISKGKVFFGQIKNGPTPWQMCKSMITKSVSHIHFYWWLYDSFGKSHGIWDQMNQISNPTHETLENALNVSLPSSLKRGNDTWFPALWWRWKTMVSKCFV